MSYKDKKLMNIRTIVLTALFAALIATGSYIAIPMAPVPITLQTFFILSAGLICGRKVGTGSVLVFLIAGAIGLPVFSGGTGGIAHLAGPTGGYLFGYLLSGLIAGTFSDLARKVPRKDDSKEEAGSGVLVLLIIGGIAAACSVYLIGLPWLKVNLDFTWTKAFAAGMIPFLIGDAIKTAAAIMLARVLFRRIDAFLNQGA